MWPVLAELHPVGGEHKKRMLQALLPVSTHGIEHNPCMQSSVFQADRRVSDMAAC